MSRSVFAQGAGGESDNRARAVERALEILRNVVGLDVDAYNWSDSSYKKELYWSLLHEFVIFDFWNDESELMVTVVFADGRLKSASVLPRKGMPLMVYVADGMAVAVDRALSIIRCVVGLNVDAYNWRVRAYGKDLFGEVLFWNLPHEFVGFDFWTDGSRLDAYVDFVNGKIQSINLFPHEGAPLMAREVQQAANEVEAAKGFLGRYQAYCGAAHVEDFKAILDAVEPKTNTLKVYGNIKFEAKYDKSFVEWENRTIDTATFSWIYTFKGVEAFDKRLSISFRNGHFNSLIDNWSFFKIGSYDINVDEEKAIEIAVNTAKNYSTRVYMGMDAEGNEIWEEVKGFKVVGVKVKGLSFANGLLENETRGGDPLTLYPAWTVVVYFDKVYAGGIYGVWLNIWADTGEIWRIYPLTGPLGIPPDMVPVEGDEEQENTTPNNGTGLTSTQIALIALPISAGIALTVLKLYMNRKRIPTKNNMPYPNQAS